MQSAHPKLDAAPPDEQAGHAAHTVHRQRPGVSYAPEPDQLAREIPIALEYNGIAHATVLATPCNLEDFAYGFSYTEGIVRSARDIYDVELEARDKGIVVQLTIAGACLNQLKLRRRNLAGRTGCGLCGLESLDEVQRTLPALPERPAFLKAQAIAAATEALRELQPLHLETGATHAAGWANMQGEIQAVREDVGRHNALDKLIGHLLQKGQDTSDGFAVISSRASFEMVQKAAAAGMSAVVAVSAPTSYAVQMANELNVLLAGFARKDVFTVYSHPEFLIPYESI
ncbi:formate dehydrogenase accessory sulfurtransferase FdhD [Pusillimonas sp.]|uniref:formate dehydrogenase accessory sulfurtransferase FdhD n=1 Tax=Pusillimonas sp. TaxID=3040095 RepID=UPI0037CC4C1F